LNGDLDLDKPSTSKTTPKKETRTTRPRKRALRTISCPSTRLQSKQAIKQRKAAFLAMYGNTLGNMTETCKRMRINRTTPYDWMRGDPAFKQAVEDVAETRIDFVEDALNKQILKGNTAAIIFFLKCKAKDRGYVERQEHTGANGGPMNPVDAWTLQHGENADAAFKSAMRKIMEDRE